MIPVLCKVGEVDCSWNNRSCFCNVVRRLNSEPARWWTGNFRVLFLVATLVEVAGFFVRFVLGLLVFFFFVFFFLLLRMIFLAFLREGTFFGGGGGSGQMGRSDSGRMELALVFLRMPLL